MNIIKKQSELLDHIENLDLIENNINPKSIEYDEKKENNGVSNFDEHLFHEGKHIEAYSFMGSHFKSENRKRGARFTTWAPNASSVYLVGSFNDWSIRDEYKLERINDNGLWSIFIPGLKEESEYKLAIENNGNIVFKCDPYAFKTELRPNTASILSDIPKFKWSDKKWLNNRELSDIKKLPMNIYEVHLSSWKTKDGQIMTYEELSEILPKYVKEMGYTHIELMALAEHPLDASWGYQATGYYAPTARHGNPKGLKSLINNFHKENIGVILDWVPGHFCKDQHGLYMFDGTPTYEYKAFWKANNSGWGTFNFDLGRPEVKSFLISNAVYWIKEYHIDGLRVDAVSNMLYLNYGREDGEWEKNCFGDNGNLEGIQFIKDFNNIIKSNFKGVVTIAEESTDWKNITSTDNYGLGFDFKWNMGWMNDTLKYIELDPVYRKYEHSKINFSMMYNYDESFILPISHDEVVHGKKSLLNKMWGDKWNKYAGLRLYSAFMIGHPGKKLLFMGSEFGQFLEWREYEQLEWHVIDEHESHKQTHNYFKDLNHFYTDNKALWELDYDVNGFTWIDADNCDQNIISFIRRGSQKEDTLIFIYNFNSTVKYDYNIGVPYLEDYKEVFNSDELKYGGTGQVMNDVLFSKDNPYNNQPYMLTIKIPPMAVSVLKLKNN